MQDLRFEAFRAVKIIKELVDNLYFKGIRFSIHTV